MFMKQNGIHLLEIIARYDVPRLEKAEDARFTERTGSPIKYSNASFIFVG